VLVLDADLLLFDAYPAIQQNNYNEVFMQIKLSRWMRILWTLQEALLGRDLWFQFRNGSLRFRDMQSTFESLEIQVHSPLAPLSITQLYPS
jgi:hypothetical protein